MLRQDAQSAESRFAWVVQLTKTIKSVLFAYLGRVGTVQSPLLLTNGGQLWRIDGSPVELNRSGRDLRRDRFREWKLKSQPIANPGNPAKDRPFQKQHRDQGCAEQGQVDPEQHDQDEKPGRERGLAAGPGAPKTPGSRRRHHMTTELTLSKIRPTAVTSPRSWLGQPKSCPSWTAMPVPTILSIK